MSTHIERDLRFLKFYALFSTLAFCMLGVAAFTTRQAPQADGAADAIAKANGTRFDELSVGSLNVERINVVEKDGALKLVMSNKQRAPDAFISGKTFPRQGGNSAGLIFYNDDGDEVGGLTFGNRRREGGGNSSNAVILFDQYKQDQTLGLMYGEQDGKRTAGLYVWDRPEMPLDQLMDKLNAAKTEEDKAAFVKALQEKGEAGARRVFVGKLADRTATVSLADLRGKPRLVLKVDEKGAASIEFLDDAGKVVRKIPE
jgi:hypothetical protein